VTNRSEDVEDQVGAERPSFQRSSRLGKARLWHTAGSFWTISTIGVSLTNSYYAFADNAYDFRYSGTLSDTAATATTCSSVARSRDMATAREVARVSPNCDHVRGPRETRLVHLPRLRRPAASLRQRSTVQRVWVAPRSWSGPQACATLATGDPPGTPTASSAIR
jgi:hypothetical protein